MNKTQLLLTLAVVCTIADSLQTIRPGAEWTLQGNTYAGLNWTEKVQAKPTQQEIIDGIATCQATQTARITLKQQARLDVKNTGLTQAQRLQALLILLDYDQ